MNSWRRLYTVASDHDGVLTNLRRDVSHSPLLLLNRRECVILSSVGREPGWVAPTDKSGPNNGVAPLIVHAIEFSRTVALPNTEVSQRVFRISQKEDLFQRGPFLRKSSLEDSLQTGFLDVKRTFKMGVLDPACEV